MAEPTEPQMQRARAFIYETVDVSALDGPITSEAGARVVALAMSAEAEWCAGVAYTMTATRGQTNAKDRWREQIGREIADAIRKRSA